MDRAAARTYIASEFSELLTETGLSSSTAFENSIDNALRLLGYGESDLATADVTDHIKNYQVLLEYFALKRFVRSLALKIKYTIDGQTYEEQTLYDHVAEMLKDAEAEATKLGYAVKGNSFELDTITLGFLGGPLDY